MSFLKRAIRDAVSQGISKGIGDAVGKAVREVVEPRATEYANKAADRFDRLVRCLIRYVADDQRVLPFGSLAVIAPALRFEKAEVALVRLRVEF